MQQGEEYSGDDENEEAEEEEVDLNDLVWELPLPFVTVLVFKCMSKHPRSLLFQSFVRPESDLNHVTFVKTDTRCGRPWPLIPVSVCLRYS